MINLQNTKIVPLSNAASIATNATGTMTFSMVGYHNAAVYVMYEKATSGGTVQPPTITIAKSTDGTTYSNISGLQGTTGTPGSTQFAIPASNNTSSPTALRLNIPHNTGDAYIKVSITTNTGYLLPGVFAILSQAEQTPNTTTEAGLIADVFPVVS